MRITFHGAAGGVVTGSAHLLEAGGHRVLLDCGMVQGSRAAEASNAEPFWFDPATLDGLVLSHAHIDHVGRVPLLVKRGFRGPIWAQDATCDLLPIMLLDAAAIAEQNAERAKRPNGEDADVEPLYTREDVAAVASFAECADRLLLDTKAPKDATRPGGTGQTFDWSLLKALDPALSFMLSGGLTPDNVATAIAAVRPLGVDVSSGVETAPGVKDAKLVRTFIERARAAST